jgi:hypothetical protein
VRRQSLDIIVSGAFCAKKQLFFSLLTVRRQFIPPLEALTDFFVTAPRSRENIEKSATEIRRDPHALGSQFYFARALSI